jgi:hypothetical protein
LAKRQNLISKKKKLSATTFLLLQHGKMPHGTKNQALIPMKIGYHKNFNFTCFAGNLAEYLLIM